MVIQLGLLVVGAYLLGSVPSAYLVARFSHGIDLRRYGSGSIGASNLWKSTNRYLALPVILFDLGKGAIMVWLAYLMGLGVASQAGVALAAVIGHNWPVFLRFSGGRGVLAILGVAIFFPVINNSIPWGALLGVTIAGVGMFVFHSAPLAVGIAIALLPLVSWATGEPSALTLGFLAMFLVTVIRRLTAPRTSLTDSVTVGQLLINRLLFDRDIGDREAWIHRQPLEQRGRQEKG
ncbi:glycerol-3-phosphate acyltransferase [Chloroflexota bacterium]